MHLMQQRQTSNERMIDMRNKDRFRSQRVATDLAAEIKTGVFQAVITLIKPFLNGPVSGAISLQRRENVMASAGGTCNAIQSTCLHHQ
jgi:hypothetical protein